MSRYIKIPESITILNFKGEPMLDEKTNKEVVFTFEDFIWGRLSEAVFAKNMANIAIALEIRSAMLKAKDTGVLELPEGHWKLLKEATENPAERSFTAAYAWNFMPFMKSICDASDKAPIACEQAPKTAEEKKTSDGQSAPATAEVQVS